MKHSEILLKLFEEKTEFERTFYYNFKEITENNLFLINSFTGQEVKLSFNDKKNLKYKKEYTSSSIIILGDFSRGVERRIRKLYSSFLFFEKLIVLNQISLEAMALILEGQLHKAVEKLPEEIKTRIFLYYGLEEKVYFLKTPEIASYEEMIVYISKKQKEISEIVNKVVDLRYAGPYKWFYKLLLDKFQEEKIKKIIS